MVTTTKATGLDKTPPHVASDLIVNDSRWDVPIALIKYQFFSVHQYPQNFMSFYEIRHTFKSVTLFKIIYNL